MNKQSNAKQKNAAAQASSSRPNAPGNQNNNKGDVQGQDAVAAPTTVQTAMQPTNKPVLPLKEWFPAHLNLIPKQDSVVEFQKLADMSIEERVAMLDGTPVYAICGANVFHFPARVMLLICPKVRREYIQHSLKDQRVDALVVHGVERIHKFLKQSLSATRPFRLRSSDDGAAGFALDLDTIIAAEILGIDQLVGPLRNYWWKWLKINLVDKIDFEVLKVIENRISVNIQSTIIDMVVQTYARLYARGEMEEPNRTAFRSVIILLPKMWHRFFRCLEIERAKIAQS